MFSLEKFRSENHFGFGPFPNCQHWKHFHENLANEKRKYCKPSISPTTAIFHTSDKHILVEKRQLLIGREILLIMFIYKSGITDLEFTVESIPIHWS